MASGTILEAPATIVDLAPTLLAMAGVEAASLAQMDGRSLLPLLISRPDHPQLGSVARGRLAAAVAAAGGTDAIATSWRTGVLIEHLYTTPNVKCVAECSYAALNDSDHAASAARAAQIDALGPAGVVPSTDLWCANLTARSACWATPDAPDAWALPRCEADCYATEDEANNFAAVRFVTGGPFGMNGSMYVERHVGDQRLTDVMAQIVAGESSSMTVELYDQATDLWQMRNLARLDMLGEESGGLEVAHIQAYYNGHAQNAIEASRAELRLYTSCTGAECP